MDFKKGDLVKTIFPGCCWWGLVLESSKIKTSVYWFYSPSPTRYPRTPGIEQNINVKNVVKAY